MMASPKNLLCLILAWFMVLALGLGPGCAPKKAPAPPPSAPKPAPKKAPKPYTVLGKTYQPLATADGYSQEGTASWYGPKFHGRRTSSGEVYDMDKMTAAHKILPLNTWVEVTNLDNGRKIRVRVNDRGPFVEGRIIDLSREAARKLEVIGPGTARVRVDALGLMVPGTGQAGRPAKFKSAPLGPFSVQVGAFASESNAWRLAAVLRAQYEPVKVVKYDRGDMVFYRVRVGLVDNLAQADKLESELRARGYGQAFAVAD